MVQTSEGKQRFLTVYDYGMGGCWQFIYARSKAEILEKFPDLEIVDSVPKQMDDDQLAKMRVYDIDGLLDEFMISLLRLKK